MADSTVRESFLRTKIKSLIPFWLQKVLYSGVKFYRLTKNKFSGTYSKEDLKKWLTDAGIAPGDTIMLHSSLGRIGFVEGGADSLIDAFLEIIGPEGTLVMPTFSTPPFDEAKGLYYFDVSQTPAYTGAIPETFRKREGVLRSISPMHSIAAFGKHAKMIAAGHEKCDNPYAFNGPFGRLYAHNAKIVQIGVDQLANSSIHIVEDKVKFPIEVFTEKMKAEVTDVHGKKHLIEFRKHLPHLFKLRKNNIMEDYLKAEGKLSIHPFGKTEIRVHRAQDLVHKMEGLLRENITIYNQ